jgi:Ca2+:H+ antiporter
MMSPSRFSLKPLYVLLLAFPGALILEFTHAGGLWVFVASALAIIPLAELMGRATESLADALGPGPGGLLNATFGNAAELIIALLALWKGEADLVKASITGSILGNILLVLGMAIFVGGLFHKRQTFNRTAAGLGATLLALATIGLIVPTVHYYLVQIHPAEQNGIVELLSEEIAAILAFLYLLSLFFSLKTHQHLFAGEQWGPGETEPPEWGRGRAILVLVVATAGIAVMSELLVGSVGAAAEALGMNRVFIGVIVVAVVGNAAEHSTAVVVAAKNKMDLAVTIAVGSGIQVALFVAPVLVFAALAMGVPFDLHFTPMEVVAVMSALGVLTLVSQDGECHWMEGALLLAVYVILALAFYHLP